MRTVAGLLLGALIAIAIACGGAAKTSSMSPASVKSEPHGAGMPPTPQRSEIEKLDLEIGQAIEKLSIARPLGLPKMNPAAANIVPPTTDTTCKPAPSDDCRDTCTLGDSICNNAKRICEIAAELGNDDWANEKCAGGKASCDAAREKCCNCT
jgi:hypothetical protein